MERPEINEILDILNQKKQLVLNAVKGNENTSNPSDLPYINFDSIQGESQLLTGFKNQLIDWIDSLIVYLQNPDERLTEAAVHEIKRSITEYGKPLQPTYIDFLGWKDSLENFRTAKTIDKNPFLQQKIFKLFFDLDILNLDEMNRFLGMNLNKKEWISLISLFMNDIDNTNNVEFLKSKYQIFLESRGLRTNKGFRETFSTLIVNVVDNMTKVAGDLAIEFGGDMYINMISIIVANFFEAEFGVSNE